MTSAETRSISLYKPHAAKNFGIRRSYITKFDIQFLLLRFAFILKWDGQLSENDDVYYIKACRAGSNFYSDI
jgi:hypothetical protein